MIFFINFAEIYNKRLISKMEFTAQQIAMFTGGTVDGDENAIVSTFAKIEEGVPGALSFLANPQYESYIYETKSSVVLVNRDFAPKENVSATLVRVDNAYEAVAKLLALYDSMKKRKTGVSDRAYVSESAVMGEDCYVAPLAYIGDNVVLGKGVSVYPNAVICDGAKIGDNSIIYPNVTIYHDCVVGSRVIIHSGAVIGADGFGFAPTMDGYEKIPQIGIVTIEDDVEIGANTCVDRSTMGSTIVHKGVKLDNLVQIAHNVEVGAHTVMSSQTGVAGSAKVGEWCMFGGQVGIAGHIKVGDRTHIGAQSGVSGGSAIRKGGATVMGYPAVDHKSFARQAASLKSLPEMVTDFARMKKEIAELKELLSRNNAE